MHVACVARVVFHFGVTELQMADFDVDWGPPDYFDGLEDVWSCWKVEMWVQMADLGVDWGPPDYFDGLEDVWSCWQVEMWVQMADLGVDWRNWLGRRCGPGTRFQWPLGRARRVDSTQG